jgi:hypothetical protein
MQHDDWDEDDADDWDDDFDYESFVEQNFSDKMTNTETKPLWRWVSVILLVVFAFSVFVAMAG